MVLKYIFRRYSEGGGGGRGGSRISGKGFICIKMWGLALVVFSHFSYLSHENEIIWSHSLIFANGGEGGGGDGDGVQANPLWTRHWGPGIRVSQTPAITCV